MERGLVPKDEGKTHPTDVASVSATDERRAALAGLYDPDMDFRKLALEAQYYSKGFRLINKTELIGVPHVVIGVTYREGFPRRGAVGDYISVEAVVADKDTLASYPVRSMLPGELTVYPNETVVYNDSSTGIRREFTELFHKIGLITVGAARSDDENPYDKPFQFWAEGAELATTGIVASPDGEAFRYVAMRGLRVSEYDWQPAEGGPAQSATTFYIG